MESIMGKMVAGTAAAGRSMRRAAGNARQEGKVADLEKQVRKLTFEIGRLTVLSMDGSIQDGAPVQERYESILALRDEIAVARAAEKHLTVVCPHCGEKTVTGMRYCGHCGCEL